jgi:hypothetical protein
MHSAPADRCGDAGGRQAATGRHNELIPLELMRDGIFIRADAGVLEIFVLGSIESTRIPLRWLVVRGSPHGKKSVVLTFGSGTADQPLYEMLPKTATAPRTWLWFIKPEEEPGYRAFCTGIARSCDRHIA